MEKLQEQFSELDPETPQMIAFQEKINEIVDFINFSQREKVAEFNQFRIRSKKYENRQITSKDKF